MTTAPPLRGRTSDRVVDGLLAVVSGAGTPWAEMAASSDEVLAACRRHDLTALVAWRAKRSAPRLDWPADVMDALAHRLVSDAATELQRAREIRAVIARLGVAGIHPVLVKGTALAYTVYEAAALRPREDTDLFIRPDQADATRAAMTAMGYVEAMLAGGDVVFGQFEMSRVDEFGIAHAFDFHWRLSTQPAFAEVLTYDELAAEARPIEALAGARAAGTLHALLIACIHPAMHHRNVERIVWMLDTHLLALSVGETEWARFANLATRKGVAAVAAFHLALSRRMFQTAIPKSVMPLLTSVRGENTAAYLSDGRRWHHELASSLRDVPAFGDRLRLLRAVCFPSAAYMRRAYGVEGRALASLVLPALYAHRNVYGAWKIVTGRK